MKSNFVDIAHGNIVVLRSSRLAPMLFIGQVSGPPTDKTAMIAFYNSDTGKFGTPTRRGRDGIVGVLCTDLTVESGALQAEKLLTVRYDEIKRINDEFEEGLSSLVENPA